MKLKCPPWRLDAWRIIAVISFAALAALWLRPQRPTATTGPLDLAALIQLQTALSSGSSTSSTTSSHVASATHGTDIQPTRLPTIQDTAWPHVDDFSVHRPEWQPLAGRWIVTDGLLVQQDSTGYDFINEFGLHTPQNARLSVDMLPISGTIGAGLLISQPRKGQRNGAVIVDFTDDGRFLRWGKYDVATGDYIYLGGTAMAPSFDPTATHQLAVDVLIDRTVIRVDGTVIGTFGALPAGYVGLVTSRSAVAFDNFAVADLEPSA